MTIRFHALPTADVRALQRGGPDAHGQPAERTVSDGEGNPCRHCLQDIPKGREMLILAWRPFDDLQPYAECGPIFLCADECTLPEDQTRQPDYFSSREGVLVKGYTDQQRIKYGTGEIVAPERLKEACARILENPEVAYVHVRSSTNNCYQCRVDKT